MRNALKIALAGMLCCAGFAVAQQPVPVPVPAPAPQVAAANQLTPQVLAQMLRSATTFHELVQNLNVNNALGPDVHQVGADGRLHHSVERTAAAIGAGAGAGAAIGAMTKNPNGVMIGALVGSAGGLILDQILKAHEEQREKAAAYAADPIPQPAPQFKERH